MFCGTIILVKYYILQNSGIFKLHEGPSSFHQRLRICSNIVTGRIHQVLFQVYGTENLSFSLFYLQHYDLRIIKYNDLRAPSISSWSTYL